MANKLYTEEQVIKAIDLSRLQGAESYLVKYREEDILNMITPIQLPSDEEIEEALFHQSNEYAIGFHDAFNFLKNKLSQNKQK